MLKDKPEKVQDAAKRAFDELQNASQQTHPVYMTDIWQSITSVMHELYDNAYGEGRDQGYEEGKKHWASEIPRN